MSLHGAAVFGSSPIASSSSKENFILNLNRKTVHNPKDVLAQIEGRAEGGVIDLGTCSLCYDDVHRNKLIKACGRSGCDNKVDEKCLQEWVCLIFKLVISSETYLTIDIVRQVSPRRTSQPHPATLPLLSPPSDGQSPFSIQRPRHNPLRPANCTRRHTFLLCVVH